MSGPAVLTFAIALSALGSSCFAGDTRYFYGAWKPPSSLQAFWTPVSDSWWRSGKGSTPQLQRRCRKFAKANRPEAIIPDMISDLRANQSEVRWFVYLHVMLNWPKDRVLRCLESFQRSADADVRHIANEFYADVE